MEMELFANQLMMKVSDRDSQKWLNICLIFLVETCTTKICPQFSTCIQDPHTRQARCLCKEGWQMTDDHENHINGIFKSVCKPKQCNEYYNCDTNANCVINENTQKYECICKPGW